MDQYSIQSLESFDSVNLDEWNTVLAQSSVQTVFQSYEWNRLVWKYHNNDQLVLLCIRAKPTGKPVGFAPLFLSEDEKLKTIHLIGELRGDYADLVIDKYRAKGVLQAIITYLFQQYPSVSFLQLEKIPPTSDLLTYTQKIHPRTLITRAAVCPTWLFADDTIRQIDKKLNNKKMRYYQRRLAKLGEYRIEHLSEFKDIAPYLDTFYELHIERWSSTPWPSRFLSQEERNFYYSQVKVFATKKAILFSLLYLGNEPVGFHLGFFSKERFIWYKPTYNIKYKKYSPGLVLMKECIQYALDMGCKEFDFAAGNEPYKRRFGNQIRQNYNIVIYANTWHFWLRKLKDYLVFVKLYIKKIVAND